MAMTAADMLVNVLHRVTLEQAAHLAEALFKGEPHRMQIALTVLSDRVREMV